MNKTIQSLGNQVRLINRFPDCHDGRLPNWDIAGSRVLRLQMIIRQLPKWLRQIVEKGPRRSREDCSLLRYPRVPSSGPGQSGPHFRLYDRRESKENLPFRTLFSQVCSFLSFVVDFSSWPLKGRTQMAIPEQVFLSYGCAHKASVFRPSSESGGVLGWDWHRRGST